MTFDLEQLEKTAECAPDTCHSFWGPVEPLLGLPYFLTEKPPGQAVHPSKKAASTYLGEPVLKTCPSPHRHLGGFSGYCSSHDLEPWQRTC